MNSIVVYDSQYGNTERIARTITETLRAFGSARAIRVELAHQLSFEGVDLLIVGSPTQGFRPTVAMQSFLGHLSDQLSGDLAVACFDTRFHGLLRKNSAAPRMAKLLRALGADLLAAPESFFVQSMKKEGPLLDGEEERATTWALGVHHQYEEQAAHLAAR